jgi:hypothetical protein
VLLFDPTVPLSFDKDGERVCGNNTGVGVAVTAGVVDGGTVVDVGVATGVVVVGADGLSHLSYSGKESATTKM